MTENFSYYGEPPQDNATVYCEEENTGVPFGIITDINPYRDYSLMFDDNALEDEFGCVYVEDALFEMWLPRTYGLETYSKSLKNPQSGIPQYGVTILPHDTILELIKIIIDGRSVYTEEQEKATDELLDLLGAAYRNDGHVICFGEN